MQNYKNLLILGADGFIGSNLVDALLKEGYSIVAFDQFKEGKSKNLEHLRGKIKFISGDFLNLKDIKKALMGIDCVFHFISLTTPVSSKDEPLMDVEVNLKPSIDLLTACVNAGVKKVVFASSGGSIYGDQEKERYSELDATFPISPYAISKLAIERYLEYFRINYGLEYIALRYSNPYGPNQNITGGQGIIPVFLNMIKNKKPLVIFGNGENLRDYIYIDDLINITLKIFNKNSRESIFNIGSGTGASINELIDVMRKVTNSNPSVEYNPSRTTDVKRVILDINKVQKEIGKIDALSLNEGIMRTWEWIINE